MRKFAVVFLIALLSQLGFSQTDTAKYRSAYKGEEMDSVFRSVRSQKIFNAALYGANPSLSDNRAAIQYTIDLAYASGGGIAYIPEGTYTVGTITNADNGNVCLTIYSNTELRGAGMYKTIIRRANATGEFQTMVVNRLVGGGTGRDSNIVISDISFDGNSIGNRGLSYRSQHGIFMYNAKKVWLKNVRVAHVFGTTSGANFGEGMSIAFSSSAHIFHENCVAEGDSISSTGFGANSSVDVHYTDCISYDHKVGAGGFTAWECLNVKYVSCSAWGNIAYAGFNSEASGDVSYVGCSAGLIVPSITSYPYAGGTVLPNAHGFVIGGSRGLNSYIDCYALGNTIDGLESPNHQNVVVVGGRYSKNGQYGIHLISQGPKVSILNADLDSNLIGHQAMIGTKVIDNTGPISYGVINADSLKIESNSHANLTFSDIGKHPDWSVVYKPTEGNRLDFVDSSGNIRIAMVPGPPDTSFFNLSGGLEIKSAATNIFGPTNALSLYSMGVVAASGSSLMSHYASPDTDKGTSRRIGGLFGDTQVRYGLYADELALELMTLGDHDFRFRRNFSDYVLTIGATESHFTTDVRTDGIFYGDGSGITGAVSATYITKSFSTADRDATYVPGTLSTDSWLASWQPATEVGTPGGGRVWATAKTDSVIVRCDTVCSTQFTIMRLK